MGCHILTSEGGQSVLFCSCTDWAFGPVMESAEIAEAFCKYLPDDPRTYSEKELQSHYCAFRSANVCQCGTVRHDGCYFCAEGIPLENGIHDDEGFEVNCEHQPEPPAGESFECGYCAEARVRKAQKVVTQ